MKSYEVRLDEQQRIVELRLAGNVAAADHVKARDALLALCRAATRFADGGASARMRRSTGVIA